MKHVVFMTASGMAALMYMGAPGLLVIGWIGFVVFCGFMFGLITE